MSSLVEGATLSQLKKGQGETNARLEELLRAQAETNRLLGELYTMLNAANATAAATALAGKVYEDLWRL